MTAKVDLARYERLGREGWIPAQRLDLVRNNYAAAVDQIGVLRQQRAQAEAQVAAAAKSLALARSQLAKTRIQVPLSASVLERLVEPGEVVAAGQPVAILANLSTVRLKVFVGERDVGKVRLGALVRIRVDAFPDRYFEARVRGWTPRRSSRRAMSTWKTSAAAPFTESPWRPPIATGC